MTRIKDEQRGEILIFKEAEWQTLRVETNALANADSSEEERLLHTPLRLIANQSKVRITMKKRLSGKKCLKNLTHLPSDVRYLSEILCVCHWVSVLLESGKCADTTGLMCTNYVRVRRFVHRRVLLYRLRDHQLSSSRRSRRHLVGVDRLADEGGNHLHGLTARHHSEVEQTKQASRS